MLSKCNPLGYRYANTDRESIENITKIVEKGTNHDGPDIASIVQQDRFAKYRAVHKRVCSYLDHFQVQYHREDVETKIGIFCVWLKLVDDDMESDPSLGKAVLDSLRNSSPKSDEETKTEPSKYLTEMLKKQIDPSVYGRVLGALSNLYQVTFDNDNSTDINGYIAKRKSGGELLAEVVYQIIEPDLSGDLDKFKEFFMQLGGVANLTDSCVDIKRDIVDGKFKFGVTTLDILKLYMATAKEGTKLVVSYPSLFPKFVKHILKNLRYLRQLI